jgi:hypothetical protein
VKIGVRPGGDRQHQHPTHDREDQRDPVRPRVSHRPLLDLAPDRDRSQESAPVGRTRMSVRATLTVTSTGASVEASSASWVA